MDPMGSSVRGIYKGTGSSDMKTFPLIIILLVITLLTSWKTISSSYISNVAGVAFLRSELSDRQIDMRSTVRWLDIAVDNYPESPSIHFWLGKLLFKTDRGKAAEHLNLLTRQPDRRSLAYYWLGELYGEAGDVGMIITNWREIPEMPTLLLMRANIMINDGRLTEAIDTLNIVLQLDPSYTVAYRHLSNLHQNLGDYETAMLLCQRLHEIEGALTSSLACSGEVLYYQGKFEEAIVEFAQAIDHSPTNPGLHYWLGRSYRRVGEIEKAVDQLQKAIKHEDRDVVSWYHYDLGLAYEAGGEISMAMEEYREVLKLDPDHYYADEARLRIKQLERQKP